MARKSDEDRLEDTKNEIIKLQELQRDLEKKIKAKQEAERQKSALNIAALLESQGVKDLNDPKLQEILKNAVAKAESETETA